MQAGAQNVTQSMVVFYAHKGRNRHGIRCRRPIAVSAHCGSAASAFYNRNREQIVAFAAGGLTS
jgi:hypothetical protein